MVMEEILSWETLREHKGKIICFGAGMVLLHIEQMLDVWGILEKVCFIADNNPAKWGKSIRYGGKIHKILSAKALKKMTLSDPLILVTAEKDKEIMSQLNENVSFCNWKIASYPKLNHLYKVKMNPSIPGFGFEAKYCIPKIIHYIWFGGTKIPEEQKRFIDGWQKICKGYEFMLWNELNYDINKCVYMREAYEAGDYAHASDYARMDILYQYGGFYMDTDVELIKSLEGLRRHLAVFAYGEWPVVNSAVLCGAVAHHETVKQIRDIPRARKHYYSHKGERDNMTNCYYEQEILKKIGFKGDFTSQFIDGIAVYSPLYFASKGRYFDSQDIGPEIIAVHHCAGSWKR